MLTAKNNVTLVRQDVMERVAKSFIENNLSDINSVFEELTNKYNYRKTRLYIPHRL